VACQFLLARLSAFGGKFGSEKGKVQNPARPQRGEGRQLELFLKYTASYLLGNKVKIQ